MTTRTCSKCGQQTAGTLHRCAHDRAAHFSAEAMARVGTRLEDFELRGVIGEGVIGVVYRAQNLVSDKPVAIKVLHGHCAQQKDVVEKLIVEARAASRIHHPNIADVTDFGTTPDGTVFLVMEYLEGESLEDRLREAHHLPLFEAINIVRQVAHGLGAAHDLGIVHRDLKTANIFLCKREGRRRIVRRGKETGMRFAVTPEGSFDLVKLLDFGAARFIDFAPSAQTPAGVLGGTLHYLSPEQVQGRPTDQRSDIYALGAIFYEMLTGTVPFSGETVLDVLNGHLSGVVTAPSRRAPDARMDLRIDSLILKCLKKNPLMRFASTDELREVLDACVTDCAFLRDAHRLPGIKYSGLDLSEASPEARHGSAPVEEKPAAPVAKPAAVIPVAEKPAAQPVARTAAVTPAKAATAALFAQRPAATPPPPKHAAAAPLAKTAAIAPPTKSASAKPQLDVSAVVSSAAPEPTKMPMADDPAASVITPPPVVTAASSPAKVPAGIADEPGATVPERPGASPSEVDDGPESLEVENRPFSKPARSSGLRIMALASALLTGGLVAAIWLGRSGSAPGPAKPAAATNRAPASTPATPAPPVAATPSAPPAAPTPAAPAVAPVAPVEPVEPAEPAKTTAKTVDPGPPKLATARPRPLHQSARRIAPGMPVSSEAAPSPASEGTHPPEPAIAPPAPSRAAAAPEPAPPAPASADDLLHEAQQAWIRGHHALAISKAQAALKADPTRAQALQAYQIITSSSCAIGEATGAREGASHLDESKREMVKAVCAKNGVTIE